MTNLDSKSFPITAGLDIHRNSIVCALLLDKDRIIKASFTRDRTGVDLLIDFLRQYGCKQVVMEPTGPYHILVYDKLSEAGFKVFLINALDSSTRGEIKTDFRDAERLVRRFLTGEIRPSFVPKGSVRELRNLTRRRQKLVAIRATVKNLIRAEVDELAIPIDKVFSSIGKKARELLLTITSGEDLEALLARYPSLRGKMEAIRAILDIEIPEVNGFMINVLVKLLMEIDKAIKEIDDAIERIVTRCDRLLNSVKLLMTIPGVGFIAAVTILAEIGDIARFPSYKSLTMYAGLCLRIIQSGGKFYQGPLPWRCNKRLRWIMYEVAQSLLRTKSKLKSFYGRIRKRKGHKVATIALARKILIGIWHMLTRNEP
ncbi:MAG: IS110 family transposase [Candidatus Njordarchaeia archaeon]